MADKYQPPSTEILWEIEWAGEFGKCVAVSKAQTAYAAWQRLRMRRVIPHFSNCKVRPL